ncbi:hypothetical protein Adt_18947 [Abeliophyllum distichum]|uniref:Uncharacterized protein n=1 Tax=Abeliophyllum distichum TaxID=126358 RepID=A0ABD1TKU2_9LAMI
MDKEKRPRPSLASLSKQKPRALTAGSSEEVRQKKVLEDMSREGNKEAIEASKVIEVDDSIAPEGGVPLSRKRKSRVPGTEAPQGSVEIVDDYATCSAPPLQRTLVMNTSGEVVLEGSPQEASLASAIRSLGNADESSRRVSGHVCRSRDSSVLAASKFDKEHKQALEGLQAALDSARMAYEQMEADLKESDSNVLNLTKQPFDATFLLHSSPVSQTLI